MWQRASSGGSGGGYGNTLMLFSVSASGISSNEFYNEDLLTYVSGTISSTNGKPDATFTSKVSGKLSIFINNGDNAGKSYVSINGTEVCTADRNSSYKKNVIDIPISSGDTVRIASTAYYADIIIVLQ